MDMKLEDITLEEIVLIHNRFNYQCSKCPLCVLGAACSMIVKTDLQQDIEVDKKCE